MYNPETARKKLSKVFSLRAIVREFRDGIWEYDNAEYWRPKNFKDCQKIRGACPYVGCRYHLFLDYKKSGSIEFNFWGEKPSDLKCTCALKFAGSGEHALSAVGKVMGLTRERVRQIEKIAINKLVKRLVALGVIDKADVNRCKAALIECGMKEAKKKVA